MPRDVGQITELGVWVAVVATAPQTVFGRSDESSDITPRVVQEQGPGELKYHQRRPPRGILPEYVILLAVTTPLSLRPPGVALIAPACPIAACVDAVFMRPITTPVRVVVGTTVDYNRLEESGS
ncbi:hypothetical protein BJY52DRAFT_1220410 [Lactarius psammicola]|nr:hypothetical protein BJY52DRAFT_1220410 [Lactarius psammicola]